MLILVGIDFALGLNVLIGMLRVMVGNGTKPVSGNQSEPNVLCSAMSVAMLWMVTLGGEQEISDNEEVIGDRSSFSQLTTNRSLSCFINGLLTVVAQLLNGQSFSFGRLFPLPFNHFSNLSFSNSS